jgi:hypothetical protein
MSCLRKNYLHFTVLSDLLCTLSEHAETTEPSGFHYPSNSIGRPLLGVLVTTDGVWIGE